MVRPSLTQRPAPPINPRGGSFPWQSTEGPSRVVRWVLGERVLCHLMNQGDRLPIADAEARTAMTMLQSQRGFLGALSRIYGVDLGSGFAQILSIRRIDGTPEFAAHPEHRRRVVTELCARTFSGAGFVVVRPARTMWIPGWAGAVPPGVGEVFALCHMFGACGFAQLCDDGLDRPVPLLVQPWTPALGLLEPRRLPRRSFSRSLCVQRLGHGRMVLLEKPRPDARLLA